jgi:hypothetical protein
VEMGCCNGYYLDIIIVIQLKTSESVGIIGISLLTFLLFQNLRENLSGNVKKDLR